MWKKDRELSRKDHLTGVMNLRAFTELVEYEILRLQRDGSHFSVAYLDLDNFKAVNDRFGHNKGDEVLKTTVATLVESLRKTDVVARIGGDEFAIFLPSTDSESVKVVMDKVRERLSELSEGNQWVNTFSIGVLTCTDGECDLDKIISIADLLMYEVKKSGKNNVRYGVFPSSNL
jgi:diguanylate cyclase (GGDEF)-like protein